MLKLKQLLLLTIIAACSLIIQTNTATASSITNQSSKSALTGTVLERGSNAAMPYVNVSVYNSSDNSLVTGIITKEDGSFSIPNITKGNYFVKVSFIGFDDFKLNNVNVDGSKKTINLGTISLGEQSTKLDEVNIIADKQRVQYKVDKKVVNVAQDINAAGGTAVDVLENTPSIQVDVEGNVTVRGSGSFTVLIDGRPTALEASDALQQIPASALENIEIITNPSAKYDPDGMGGILNLVTKKGALNGFDGIVNAMGATNKSKRFDFTLNHRNDKRMFTLGFDLNERWFNGNGDTSRETYSGDTTEYQITDGYRDRKRGGYTIKLGTDLYLSPKTTLGFSADGGTFNRTTYSGGSNYYGTHDDLSNLTLSEYWTEEDEEGRSENTYGSFTGSILSNFNEEKTHKLEASVFYRYRDGDEIESQVEQYTDQDGNLLDDYALQIRTEEETVSNDIRTKVDYTRPIGEHGKLEAGLQSRIRLETEDYNFENYDTITNTWINDPDFTNAMDFNRQIHAIYSTFASQAGRLQYMLGLRGEYTYRTIIDASDTESKINRFDWFPSLHASYDITKSTQLMGSYSRRIDRPSGRDLNPFESYSNQTTIRKGNPDLAPEYTNSFDLSVLQRFGVSFISLEAFFRQTDDVITRYSELRDDGILVQQTINAGDDQSIGGELMANIEAAKWLTLNGSVSIYQYMLSTDVNGVLVDKTSTNVDGRLSGTFKFSPNSRLQIMGMYRGPSVSAQGDREQTVYTNMSYRQEFLKKKLSATLSVRDVFGTAGWRGTSSGDGFSQTFDYGPDPRIMQLTLSYKLNNFKAKENNNGDMENEADFGSGDY